MKTCTQLRRLTSIGCLTVTLALWQCSDRMLEEEDDHVHSLVTSQKKVEHDKTGLTITTFAPASVAETSATVGGEVESKKDMEVTERGILWSASPGVDSTDIELTSGSGNGAFTAPLTGLSPSTTYYYRAYAINKKGLAMGMELNFTTPASRYGTFTDARDGQTYRTIKIGNQVWLAENLNFDSGEGRYCYGNEAGNCTSHGSLYTWEAALNAVPDGWHMPSKSEYETLINYLGNSEEAYEALIIGGSSGFDADFAGFMNTDNSFIYQGQYADHWTITEETGGSGWVWIMDMNTVSETATIGADRKNRAFSLRCVQGPAEDGLVAYYPFAFGSARDQSSYGNHGLVQGGVSATEDRYGRAESAVAFNGSDGYIEVPNSTSLQAPTTALTITAWVQLSGYQPVAAGFVTKSNVTHAYGQYHLNYQNWSGPNIFFQGGTDGLSAHSFLDLGSWYFIASTYDGQNMNTYLNGTLVATRPASFVMQPDSYPLMLGIDTPGSIEYLNGKIDEIRIYSRA
ncbi:MAG TPA: FISUMP domain-containing protein, partial [Chryseosolibacter sp.]|nr:FISUMP domain-containing protein [Chryseosolibacter sp.]